jgi:hypothetical protein
MSASYGPHTFRHVIPASEVRNTLRRIIKAVEDAGFGEEAADLDQDSFVYLVLDIVRSRLLRRIQDLGFSFDFDLHECDHDRQGNILVVFLFTDERGPKALEALATAGTFGTTS